MKIFILLILIFITCSEKKQKPNWLFLALLSRNQNSSISSNETNCQNSSSNPAQDTVNGLTRIQVRPNEVCNLISTFNEPHQVFPPSTNTKNILSIFYPGTAAIASEYSLVLQRGATRGYHVIGLNYVNQDSINTICNSGSAAGANSCFGETRDEIITGQDKSRFVSVDTNNSIEGRTLALLKYLHSKRPSENWNQFYSGSDLVWNKIYVGGHSQGAGHAAYQGKIRALGRVTIYSGVSDYSTTAMTTPTWFTLPQSSLNGSYFGFIHINDSIANFSGNNNQVTDAWANSLLMTGALTDVVIGTPYGNSRRLSTNACNALSELLKHSCTMVNGFQNVWDYISYP